MEDIRAIVVTLIVALAIVGTSGIIFEACQRHGDRQQDLKTACIEKADSASEATICRQGIKT